MTELSIVLIFERTPLGSRRRITWTTGSGQTEGNGIRLDRPALAQSGIHRQADWPQTTTSRRRTAASCRGGLPAEVRFTGPCPGSRPTLAAHINRLNRLVGLGDRLLDRTPQNRGGSAPALCWRGSRPEFCRPDWRCRRPAVAARCGLSQAAVATRRALNREFLNFRPAGESQPGFLDVTLNHAERPGLAGEPPAPISHANKER